MATPVPPPEAPQQLGGYWAPPGLPGTPPGPPRRRDGFGVAAVVLGGFGTVFGLAPFLLWLMGVLDFDSPTVILLVVLLPVVVGLAGVLGLASLVFGLVGHGEARKGRASNKGMALTGTGLGGLALMLAALSVVVAVTALAGDRDRVTGAEARGRDVTPTAPPNREAPERVEPLRFGQTHVYDDGVKVTVSEPRPYKLDEFAIGHEKGDLAVQVRITIVNGGAEAIDDLAALPHVRDAAGQVPENIFDARGATKPATGALLPGRRAVAQVTLSVDPDKAGELQVEISPTPEYDSVVWIGPADGGARPS
ncbi:DUF4190 domain-containing protein [Bailinhaonella thermotolerans]|uniref:DUF4190 domain-containing protein n=1 Tax=Bailinhaonella thermotolerans TaxID=1070861 RepID=A0A3A4AQ37_9ACTN|nr:DUF4190 domain-containing protein [Bailinhaonella thermotolerans]RJL30525.1 DUF4190 domain-containing protein [Bailinhaonella thermotolerans]